MCSNGQAFLLGCGVVYEALMVEVKYSLDRLANLNDHNRTANNTVNQQLVMMISRKPV